LKLAGILASVVYHVVDVVVLGWKLVETLELFVPDLVFHVVGAVVPGSLPVAVLELVDCGLVFGDPVVDAELFDLVDSDRLAVFVGYLFVGVVAGPGWKLVGILAVFVVYPVVDVAVLGWKLVEILELVVVAYLVYYVVGAVAGLGQKLVDYQLAFSALVYHVVGAVVPGSLPAADLELVGSVLVLVDHAAGAVLVDLVGSGRLAVAVLGYPFVGAVAGPGSKLVGILVVSVLECRVVDVVFGLVLMLVGFQLVVGPGCHVVGAVAGPGSKPVAILAVVGRIGFELGHHVSTTISFSTHRR